MTDLTEHNRQHFDKVATTHQTDFGELIDAAIREFKARRGWITPALNDPPASEAKELRLLDYACGAGTVSKALAPYATQTIGLDLSSGMVAEYNKAALEMGFGIERMHAYQYNLLGTDTESESATTSLLPENTLAPFDVIVIGMALHHVSEPSVLLARFKELLKPGGVCVVMDMVPTDDAPDIEGVLEPNQLEVAKTIGKRGFSQQEMRELYEGAQMGKGFEYVVIEAKFRFTMFGHQFEVTGFMARGEVG
ncbi:S-adenosyl-L-methionine-dependent methyltransferase [Aspergillus pseudodeflectus]|uniref:S-adenosyl-L-methionine-dependent methyltransferase n=1 Tax=Aspergillus pseudodeflectus TaxID=176178 RepID=A0ABR4KGD0_9EURO